MADIVKPTVGQPGWNSAVDQVIDTVNTLVPAVAGKAATGHTHTSAAVTDFTEAVQDAVAQLLGAGSNVIVNYDDAANTLTISATGSGGTGLDAEAVRDAIGVALVGVGNISVVVNDAADTITITTTATVNSTDAALRDRGTHTNTQSADTVDETAGRKWLTAAERTKLSGVAAGATAYSDEAAQDAAAALFTSGTHAGVGFVYDDATGKVNATVTGGGGGGVTQQQVQAAVDASAAQFSDRLALTEAGWVAPAPGEPGAALVPDAGGHHFFDRFPAAKRFADPNVFPIGAHLVSITSRGDVIRDTDTGINLYAELTNDSTLALLAGQNAISAMLAVEAGNGYWPQQIASAPNQAGADRVVGWYVSDETDMNGGPFDGPPHITNDLLPLIPAGDGRFRYINYGKGVAFWQTDPQAATFVNLPGIDAISADIYFFTDNDLLQESQGGKLLYTDGGAPTQKTLTADELHLGANYASVINRLRRLQAVKRSRPVWAFVEVGHPFGDNSWPEITTAEIVSATWHSIIAGATGILYFTHNFGSNYQTANVLRDSRYTATRDAVAALNQRITALARVLNGPTVTGLASVTAGSAKLLHKLVGGKHYLIVGSAARGSQQVTITVPTGAYATVVHEGRRVAVSTGSFTDTFADHNAIHIYRLDTAQVTIPALPAPPQHKLYADWSGAANSGSVGAPVIGNAFQVLRTGSWGRDGNGFAYQATGNSCQLVSDCGTADGVLSQVVGVPGNGGLAFRQKTDGTGYNVNFNGGSYNLAIYEEGVRQAFSTPSPNAGDLVEIVMAGTSITVRINGTVRGSFTDANQQTATRHGLYGGSATENGPFGVAKHGLLKFVG